MTSTPASVTSAAETSGQHTPGNSVGGPSEPLTDGLPRHPSDAASTSAPARPAGFALTRSLPLGKVRFFKLDPRTKLLTLALANYFAYDFNSHLVGLTTALTIMFLLSTRMRWTTWFKLLAFMVFTAGCSYSLVFLSGVPVLGFVAMIGLWLYHMTMSIAVAIYVFTSTRIAEFTAALYSLHVPKGLVVPFSVMLRFVPTVIREIRDISEAMRLRGVFPGAWGTLLHPARTAEFIVVPLMASSTRMADDLSASGLLRGMARTGKRTCVTHLGFTFNDAIMLLILAGIFALKFSGVDFL